MTGGELFFCLSASTDKYASTGGLVDIRRSIEKGAAGIVYQRMLPITLPLQVLAYPVDNVLDSFREVARLWRQCFDLPIVAVAGTAGKTTTKDLIQSITSAHCDSHCTNENENGYLGVPSTICQIRPQHQVAIVEIGIDRPEAMASHLAIVQPSHALLTNLGLEHLTRLRDLTTVVNEEMELFHFVARRGGTLFINLDDELIVSACEKLSGGVRIGLTMQDNFASSGGRARIQRMFRGRAKDGELEIHDGNSWQRVKARLPGLHNARNTLSAWAVATVLGVPQNCIRMGLRKFVSPKWRSEIADFDKIEIICDHYNANPISMSAAIQLLSERKGARHGKAWACLGEMAEMSQNDRDTHRALALDVHRLGIDNVIAIGKSCKYLIEELTRMGSDVNTWYVHNCSEMADIIFARASRFDTVLFKGSRSNHLEDAWERLYALHVCRRHRQSGFSGL